MSVEVATLTDAVESAHEWEALARTAVEPNAFLDPRFLRTCVEHWPEAAELRVALARDAGALVAVHAFTRARVELQGFSPMAAATSGALMDAVIPLRRPLLSAADPAAAARTLLRGMRRRGTPGLLAMVDVPAEGAVADALRQAAGSLRLPRHTLSSFSSTWTPPRSVGGGAGGPDVGPAPTEDLAAIVAAQPHLTTPRRKDILRRLRGMVRELGVVSIVDRGQDAAAIEDFLDLEAAGWKGDPSRDGAAYRVLGRDDWLRALAARFRKTDELSVFEISAGGSRVYMSIVLRSGRGAFALRDAFDESAARFSPGNLGKAVQTELLLSREGTDFFDPCLGRAQGPSLQLYPQPKLYESYLLASRGVVRGTALRAYAWASGRRRAAAPRPEAVA